MDHDNESTSIILVVDNDPASLITMPALLARRGYLVETVATGHAALTRLAVGSVQLVLLDVRLPDIDGITLARLIQKKYVNIPVIFITADAALLNGMEQSAYAVLEKPFKLIGADSIYAVIQRCLRDTSIVRHLQGLTGSVAALHENIDKLNARMEEWVVAINTNLKERATQLADEQKVIEAKLNAHTIDTATKLRTLNVSSKLFAPLRTPLVKWIVRGLLAVILVVGGYAMQELHRRVVIVDTMETETTTIKAEVRALGQQQIKILDAIEGLHHELRESAVITPPTR